jgi:primary-amine oxidase
VLDAGNYNYIMEWTFRDDGTILARAGSTGPQLSSRFGVGHMHNFTWRLDVDLNGPGDDSVYFTRHVENLTPPSTAMDDLLLIQIEGSRVWNPERFHTLEIFDRTLQNGNGRPTSYELVPLRSGSARHSEDFTKRDFWVTRFRGPTAELLADNLPNYIADQQSTLNADIVVWYTGSVHHENNERDEDDNTTPVRWTGFELHPKNLFDRTPFFTP